MNNDITRLHTRLRHWTPALGFGRITLGCPVGLIPPAAAAAWRRAVRGAEVDVRRR